MVKCKNLTLKAIAASLILMYPMEPMRYIPNIHIFVRVIGERLTSSSYPKNIDRGRNSSCYIALCAKSVGNFTTVTDRQLFGFGNL